MATTKRPVLDIVLQDETRKDIDKATDMEISGYLSVLDYRRKGIDKKCKDIKEYVKTNRINENDFNKDNHVMFGEHRLVRYTSFRFDEEQFLKTGTDSEKKVYEEWKKIEEKYQKGNSIIKF